MALVSHVHVLEDYEYFSYQIGFEHLPDVRKLIRNIDAQIVSNMSRL